MTMRPNILLIIADQHRADWLGGSSKLPLRTPHLDTLCARGVRFTRAYCDAPLCAPSRAALASGTDYARCGVPNHLYDFPPELPTYMQRLRSKGYHTSGAGKFDLHKATQQWDLGGTRDLEAWGFESGIDNEGKRDAVRSGAKRPVGPYMAFLHERGLAAIHVEDLNRRRSYFDTFPTPLPDDAYCDNWIAGNAHRLLERIPPSRPWYLAVNFAGPHEPMDVTRSMADRWKDVEFPSPNGDPRHQGVRRNYAAMIENIDRHLGELLERIEARGELDHTLVVYASDHGEMLGDAGRWGKSVPHEASIRVPLIIAGPGILGGRRVASPVALHDLAATFLESADAPSLPNATSRSLWPLLDGSRPAVRDIAVSALGDWRVVTDGRHKMIERVGAPAEVVTLDDTVTDTLLESPDPEIEYRLRSAVSSL